MRASRLLNVQCSFDRGFNIDTPKSCSFIFIARIGSRRLSTLRLLWVISGPSRLYHPNVRFRGHSGRFPIRFRESQA